MASYKFTHIESKERTELHDLLDLTSCEVSINELAANAAIPFVHHHKQNEEIYFIISGKGLLYVDGEIIPIKRDDCFKLAPEAKRCLKAGLDGMRYICIQAKANSLESYTKEDGVLDKDEEVF